MMSFDKRFKALQKKENFKIYFYIFRYLRLVIIYAK